MDREIIMMKNTNTAVNNELLDVTDLFDSEIMLRLKRTCDANPSMEWLPAYYFDICFPDGTEIGYCDLRIGYNNKVYIGGNIGYGIHEAYRGHHYSAKACLLLFKQAKKHGMDHLTISCQPENIASERNIQIAGGQFVEIAAIPEDSEMYKEGKRQVKIYYFDMTGK